RPARFVANRGIAVSDEYVYGQLLVHLAGRNLVDRRRTIRNCRCVRQPPANSRPSMRLESPGRFMESESALPYALAPRLKTSVPSAIFHFLRRPHLSRFSAPFGQTVTPGLERFQVLTQLWLIRNKYGDFTRLTMLVAAVLGH